MSGYRLAAPAGAWIDRARPLRFEFDRRTIPGFAGDTFASALLAHGVVHTGRSVKLHRPRGFLSAGVEEPNALLDVGVGALRTPLTRATEAPARDGARVFSGNAWPSLRFDLAALNARFAAWLPAGFYYKTFMWPHWHRFEPLIRRLAGLGHAADAPDPARYDEVSRRVDVLVVGAGAAGLQAAIAAARAGQAVLLLEAAPRIGGWLASEAAHAPDAAVRLAALAQELAQLGVELHTRCTAFGIYDHQLVAAVEHRGGEAGGDRRDGEVADRGGDGAPGGVRERLWKIRAARIVLATGAFERPMLFPDNDRPGVMLAGAVQRHAALHGVACGRRIVLAAACDSAYAVARALVAAGVEVAAIVEQRRGAGPGAGDAPTGVPVYPASGIVAVAGWRAVRGVSIAAMGGGGVRDLEADCVASTGGWAPAVHLHSMAGGALRWDDTASMWLPDGALPGVHNVGACAGVFDLDAALEHADAVGRGVAVPAPVGGAGAVPALPAPSPAALASLGRPPGPSFVDLQNDVTRADVELAARENYRSVEHLKRYTTLGMATDQGKTSNVNALVLMAEATQRPVAAVGTTRFRPPFTPVTLNALAAGRSGARHRPLKPLPGQAWHAAQGALCEEFGGWWRPAAYPRGAETLLEAAEREAQHVRAHVGVFDASPLGKIELYGPDAAAFLDLMYVGTMSTLRVGQARYGVLLREDGVIFDDGVVARLGDQHFWVNTTSGGAERVVLAFEEWQQCEYVQHRVLLTPVTTAWATVGVAGPKAWALLAAAGFDASFAPAQMPHMTLRDGGWRGVPVRVLRASFSGEPGWEINLPAGQTTLLLEALAQAGQAFDAAPYGVEALQILRLEKGYLHVGVDTDGTTLPGDVGLDRGVAGNAANFVGRRSLLRPTALDPARLQLVGLVPLDRRTRLPVGAHVAPHAPPAPIDGFVTSSAFSPALGHPVALAMLARGRQRLGEHVTAYHLGRPLRAEVVATPFFDPRGERLRG